MKKALTVMFAAIACIVVIVSLVMLTMAVRFGEWGRVLFYFITGLLSSEAAVYSLLCLFRGKE